MTRRRGTQPAVGVEEQDPHDDRRSPSGSTTTTKSSGFEAERVLRKRRSQDAEDADQRGGDRRGRTETSGSRGGRGCSRDPRESCTKTDLSASPSVIECSPSAVHAAARAAPRAASRRRPRRRSTVIATTRIRAGAPAIFTIERPEQREAEGERRVQRQREDAVRREQLLARDDLRDHRRLGRAEEHGHGRDEDVQQVDQREVGPDEEQTPTNASPRSTFVPIRTSRRSRRSTNTPASAENRTAGSEERQDQRADRGRRDRRLRR